MDKCHYYLSHGLWKIVEILYDPDHKLMSEYFWSLAVHPNSHGYGSHIISSPWQLSWIAINLLRSHHQHELNGNETNDEFSNKVFSTLHNEIDFQYNLRSFSSNSFVQQLFSIFSKIQTKAEVNFNDIEINSFSSNLKDLFVILLREASSTAHILIQQILQHEFFIKSIEEILSEIGEDESLCNLLVFGLCKTQKFHSHYVTSLLQASFKKNLCLLLLSTDNISLLHSVIEEDKKIFQITSRERLQLLIDKGIEPLSCFKGMITMERHFFLQMLDLINAHLNELPFMAGSKNIPPVLWPIVLLQNWNAPCLTESALLQLIDKCKESTKDKTITQITYILEWYINFCKWYEKHETVESMKNDIENEQSLLEKAKEHSVLHLINSATDLSLADWSQIKDLLQQRESQIEDVKTWDLILFDGYCIMMKIIQCLIKSSEIEYFAKLQKVTLADIAIFNEAFSNLYKEEITKILNHVKIMLQSLYPLSFRLEILENIFASIFITYDVVKNMNYFLNVSIDVEKYLEVSQIRSKAATDENLKWVKNYTGPVTPSHISRLPEEDEATRKQKLRGFISKKYIVRDLVYLVKECLEKLEKDSDAQFQTDIGVPCSIKPAQMENRLDRLLESVSEATWRLQLVTDPDFISQIGTMQFACGQDPSHNFESEWVYKTHDLDRSGLLKSRRRTAEKANESGSQSNLSPGNDNGIDSDNVESQNPRQKGLSTPAIMNQMLACDSSLVVHCLSQGDILNADHIIQMMSTEETRPNLEGELNFTRAINDLKQKLLDFSVDSLSKKINIDSAANSKSLQPIQLIASQSINSTALTNHVERFLSAYTLPSIQSHSKVSAGSVLQCIENTAAMVAIDLALTTAKTFQDFKDLLNIASKHCPELNTRIQSPISAHVTSIKPLGYIVFSQNLIALLQEVNRNQGNENGGDISLHQFLRAHQYPFSLRALKENTNFWKNLNLAFFNFEKNLEESKDLIHCKEGMLAKCQANIKEMQKIFESVIKLCENSSEFLDLGKCDVPGGEVSKSVNYCDLLSRYLSDLSSFILENIASKGEINEPITLHNLLEQSAVDIVDKLLFDYNIEPAVLEKKAQQLGFNLSASLIAGCCPRLPQLMSPAESSKCSPSDRIVLNKLSEDYKSLPPSDPNQIVKSILSELLIALQTYSANKEEGEENDLDSGKNFLTKHDMWELRNDMKIQSILEKTLDINFVDLKSLNETESRHFFICLLNLMMCHIYLSSKLEKTDGVYSKHEFFRNLAFAFLGYNVGELGFLSVLDVREILLGDEFSLGFTPRRQESWNWLRVTPDPRIMFATVDFTSFSPPLFLMDFSEYDTHIEEAISNYVYSSVTVKNNQIFINSFLESYVKKVVANKNCENYENFDEKYVCDINQVLLKFLSDHCQKDVNSYFSNLKDSDLVVKICNNRYKEIMLKLNYGCAYPQEETKKECVEKWMTRTLNESILKHFSQSSRILAVIVQKIHEAKEPTQTEVARDVFTEEKLKYLDLLFSAPWLEHASPLFHGNTVITALSKYPKEENMVRFFEDCVAAKDWAKCIEVLFALPDYFIISDLNIQRFKDMTLREATFLATREDQHNSWYFSEHILDVNLRFETVMECSPKWSGSVCCSQLSYLLRDNPNLPAELRGEIKSLIKKIRVYNTISEVASELDAKSWFDVYKIALTSPKNIIQCLVKNNQLELCLQWISLPGILNSIQSFIDSAFVLPFCEYFSQDVDFIDQLLNCLPAEKQREIYGEVIFQLTSLSSISNLLQKAIELDPSSTRYRLIEISLQILHQLDAEEQSRCVHLMSSPLLILEQLLMNTKLDALEKILKIVRKNEDKQLINQEDINDLIISYAVKAVEFDLVKTVKNSETKQSFLLGAPNVVSQEQFVPSEVPDKSQWVQDNTVTLCMCCRLVSFSMFSRRHHCRRCGRVVCGTCSTHRMKVSGYKGVAVRVCQNCYAYQSKINGDMKCSQSVDTFDSSNFTFQDFHYWKMSTDSARNATIRDEFSYEYSPNVTLCLALFNLLSDTTYLNVLLVQSEKMLKLLQLNGKLENPEIDCGLVIQIIRSLIVGAKVKYGHAGLISGVDCCDELLSQVDILQLLINNYCTRLIPSEPLNGTAVRFLRDKLVEEELWDLALEVSMKCGLDRGGVWASWGKVCLAAGSWEEARIKFSHCLKSSPKPSRNPPLIDEICRILESPTSFANAKVAQKLPENGEVVAQEVAQVLSTLKILSLGKSLPTSAVSAKGSMQFEEQIFYLSTYGSHQGLLSFYLKHEELKTAFGYLLQQHLEPDIFLESLLLPSYRSDDHEKFKSVMLAVDPSLESFKKYLAHSCVYMQKLGYLNTLYDLQIFMQDYIRAAVTCIRLYRKNAVSFTDLVSRSHYLHSALGHLEEELAILNKKKKRLDSIMKMSAKTINRQMNTIWRQLEAAKFLSACESQEKISAKDIFPDDLADKESEILTLFDGNPQRTILVKLIVLFGKNVSEGFSVAFRIVQDHQLDLESICKDIGKKLAENSRIGDIRALIDCLLTSGVGDIKSTVDQIITSSVPVLTGKNVPVSEIEPLCKLIGSVNLRISAFIETGQLIPAYILATKHNRLDDVQRIMEVAEQQGLPIIKKICMSRLNPSNESGTNDERVNLTKLESG